MTARSAGCDYLFDGLDVRFDHIRMMVDSALKSAMPLPNRLVRRIDDDLVLSSQIAQNDPPRHVWSLGFPFPLADRALTQSVNRALNNRHIQIHLTGPAIEALLVQQARDTLGLTSTTRFELVNPNEFALHFARLASMHYERVLYVDPFRFAGDSISHLQNLDHATNLLKGLARVRSTENRTLRKTRLFNPLPVREVIDEMCRSGQATLMMVCPVFIDDQWSTTLSAVQYAAERFSKVTALIPGRTALVASDANVTTLIQLARPQIELSQLPTEPMRQLSWKVFDPNFAEQPAQYGVESEVSVPGRVILAPFSSDPLRSIHPPEVASLVAAIKRQTWVNEVLVLSGSPSDQDHVRAFAQMKLAIPAAGFCDVSFDESLGRISSAEAIVTVDSAPAHAALRLGTRSVVLYRSDAWDSGSALGLLHNSHLGFGTHNAGQIPLFLTRHSLDDQTVADAVGRCLSVLTGHGALSTNTLAILRSVDRLLAIDLLASLSDTEVAGVIRRRWQSAKAMMHGMEDDAWLTISWDDSSLAGLTAMRQPPEWSNAQLISWSWRSSGIFKLAVDDML